MDTFSLPDWITIMSFILAIILGALYFARPTLLIKNESKYESKAIASNANKNVSKTLEKDLNIRIRCKNVNCLRSTIVDVQCDIVVSKTDSSSETKTIQLLKSFTPGIEWGEDYVFVAKRLQQPSFTYADYNYIIVRVFAQNIIGKKTLFKKKFKIEHPRA